MIPSLLQNLFLLPILNIHIYKILSSLQAGLGGLSFDEGQFSVFGYSLKPSNAKWYVIPIEINDMKLYRYITVWIRHAFPSNPTTYAVSIHRYTTAGREVLSQIKTGDFIRSAKLVHGQDRLILPDANWSALLLLIMFLLFICALLQRSHGSVFW